MGFSAELFENGFLKRCGIVAILGLLFASTAVAETADGELFEDVSAAMGLSHTGATYGASWGDLNGDGWPDLWVGNHNETPSLYLNVGGVSLQDITARAWRGDPGADSHGAAWADFDNDGDQDLVEVVAATIDNEGMCMGCGTNHLYVNQSGRLVESAKAYGVDLKGLARSPLWLDANDDGRLDLFVSNLRNPSLPGSTLLLNKPSGFRPVTRGFHDKRPERRMKKVRKWAGNLFSGNFKEPSQILNKTHHGFAQLADLNGDGRMDLVNHSKPLRVFSRTKKRFSDVSLELGFPPLTDTGDTAIADFDGDGDLDMYLTVGPYRLSQAIQPAPDLINATLLGHRVKKDPVAGKTLSFQTSGTLTLQLAPSWLSLDKVLLGRSGTHPTSYKLSFTPEEAMQLGMVNQAQLADGAIGISFDPVRKRWHIVNRLPAEFVDVIASSTAPIENLERFGFKEFIERGRDALLVQDGGTFSKVKIEGDAGSASSCHSVTAGDFDNDMDVDLYLVCSESVRNRANRLLLNDGTGQFSLHKTAAGGDVPGRGDVAVAADYNRDGFLDLFVTNGSDPASPFVANGPHQLLRNRGNDNHYLEIDLVGTASNRDGIGAVVTLEAGGKTQLREQNGGMHRFAQDHQRIHFGLGPNTSATSIEVRWPSGTLQTLTNVAADQILTITEASQP